MRPRGWTPAAPSETAPLGRAGVVIHDAGAANHVLSWVPYLPIAPLIFATGPALDAARGRGVEVTVQRAADLLSADWLLAGTGWSSRIESEAMRAMSDRGKPVVAVLDHWVNYRERLFSDLREEDVSTFVVTDAFANILAQVAFPVSRVTQWPNTQLEECQRDLQRMRRNNTAGNGSVLLLSEPVLSTTNRHERLSARSLIEDFITNLLPLTPWRDNPIILRLHPSDDMQSYTSLAEQTSRLTISDPTDTPLAQDLSNSCITIGLSTYALYLAFEAGVPAISLAEYYAQSFVFPPGTVMQWPSAKWV